MKEKEKPALFVRGGIFSDGYVSVRDSGVGSSSLRAFESEEDYDLSSSIVIDGDLYVENIVVHGGIVAVTGNIVSCEEGGLHGS